MPGLPTSISSSQPEPCQRMNTNSCKNGWQRPPRPSPPMSVAGRLTIRLSRAASSSWMGKPELTSGRDLMDRGFSNGAGRNRRIPDVVRRSEFRAAGPHTASNRRTQKLRRRPVCCRHQPLPLYPSDLLHQKKGSAASSSHPGDRLHRLPVVPLRSVMLAAVSRASRRLDRSQSLAVRWIGL
jgi:hypothetical protein